MESPSGWIPSETRATGSKRDVAPAEAEVVRVTPGLARSLEDYDVSVELRADWIHFQLRVRPGVPSPWQSEAQE